MTKHWKLISMFTPLLLGFIIAALLIQDLKTAQIHKEQCQFIGKGFGIERFKQSATLLYSNSGRPEDNIGLICTEMGKVVINDIVPLPIKLGDWIIVTRSNFHWIPTRYHIGIPVINPEKGEKS